MSPAGSSARLRLVSAEVMKVRTTRAWWLFLGGFAAVSALVALGNWASSHSELYPPPDLTDRGAALAQAAADRTPAGAAALAASMMTSGQFLLVLIALMLGVHVVTSEFAARTMTATFLAEPRRGRVIRAKLATAAAAGMALWAITTVLDGIVTLAFLGAQHLPMPALRSPDVARVALTGLLAYVLWTLLGAGLGAVLRNQVVTVVAGIAIYAGGFAVVELIVHLLNDAWHAPWLLGLAVLAPAQASNVMTTAGLAFPHAPPWWTGALVLTGWSAALAAAGAMSIRRSDVS